MDLYFLILAVLEPSSLYGLEIIKEINARSGGALEFKEGSLYPALHRMVKAGWVETEWQPSSSGGAPRKYYRLTKDGLRALGQKKTDWQRTRAAFDAILNHR